ncbi:hypothetical protein IVB34_12775 [Bradyrhizobium sp. 2]|nr:hypothetical protein [Bradyrhizobium sp. 2]MCK1459229.1 hypothetical protein [Bradyrhizobium sp. 2]
MTAFYKKNPLFTDAEIKDWHKVIGEQKQPSPTNAQAPKFATAEDAMKSGLQKGQTFYVGDKQYRVK